jgi:cytochrome b561
MAFLSRPTRYGVVEQSLHWLTLALVVAAYLLSVGGSEPRLYSDAMDPQRRLHETIGVAVLGVTLLRLVWRAFDNQPKSPPMPSWMALAGQLMHAALYLLLIAVPLTAIVGAWLEGHPLTLVGANNIGPWVAPVHDLGATITKVHTWAGNAILWLIGLHAGAALFHHFALKDSVLTSMLPASFARSASPRDLSVRR